MRDGYHGPIYADAATIELCNILLPDSAHLQEEDAENAWRGGYSKHAKPAPLYTSEDVAPVLKALQEIPRADSFTVSPQFTVRPHNAGHIMGASSLELTITENGKKMVVLFSGDVGRYDQSILKLFHKRRRSLRTCCCANPRMETAIIPRARRKMRWRM